MENKYFAVFILTHGRPDNVITYNTLKRCGYTGEIYLIVDNEDKTIEQYQKKYGIEKVKIFNKIEMANSMDEGNNFDDRRCPVYARNASFTFAKEINITYFWLLEDDYFYFDYRLIIQDKTIFKVIKNLDLVLNMFLEFYKKSNFKSIAFSQGGDFIGGIDNGKEIYRFSKRKCMNSFFCSIEREFSFVGVLNDDVNTFITLGSRGELFMTIPFVSLTQAATQKQKSGMSDFYLKFGTYCKAFTTVMMHPSGVKVSMMNSNNPRIHHSIKWINTTPMIIDEEYKIND